MSNIVESPLIDLTLPETIDDWERRKHAPGLWSELAGKHIIFTTPSKCVQHLSAQECIDVLNFWDRVVETHHDLRSTSVLDYKRERLVNDIQPMVGYMHAGYPIVTHLDCCESSHNECIFDVNKLKANGNWGVFHEIGHNMQRTEWTFAEAVEVTVNLFSMHAFYVLLDKNVTKQKWLLDKSKQFEKYFSEPGGPTFNNWKTNLGMALVKIDQWVLRYSKIVGKNIKPHFLMFGLPVTDKYDQILQDLEPWIVESDKKADHFFQ